MNSYDVEWLKNISAAGHAAAGRVVVRIRAQHAQAQQLAEDAIGRALEAVRRLLVRVRAAQAAIKGDTVPPFPGGLPAGEVAVCTDDRGRTWVVWRDGESFAHAMVLTTLGVNEGVAVDGTRRCVPMGTLPQTLQGLGLVDAAKAHWSRGGPIGNANAWRDALLEGNLP